jgi:serine/threonine-protein kinase
VTQRRAPSLADTLPNQVEVDRLVPDNQDTVILTRPFPDADDALSEVRRGRTESLPTIGRISRYALKYTLGEGGLGTVYAAHDPLLSRAVAIKTLHVDPSMTDPERFNALFLNEARAAGGLSHPQIVTVYDAGTSEQGPYIAMELLRGKDLRHLLAQGWRPTPSQAALIVRRVADALSYAHHKGVIHRDIKPANIFMTGRTQPRVLDFGIARIRQAESLAQRDDPQSRFHELVGGSPYYMSPEQVRRLPVDRRVDVYALGVVLYELLTGQRPFAGNSLEEIAEAVLRQPVPLAHEVNPEVPRALSEIVAQAMHRERDQRIRSARRLSQSLREWIERTDEPDMPSEGRGAEPDERHGGAKRWLLPLAALGWVLALTVIGWAIWR